MGRISGLAMLTVFFGASVATAAGPVVIEVENHDQLNKEWCAADPNVDHILILPASLFVDSQELICDSGPYKLYRIIEHDDPDDFEYYLDPPFGKENRLGCDGKAGRAMPVVAVNCRPLKGS